MDRFRGRKARATLAVAAATAVVAGVVSVPSSGAATPPAASGTLSSGISTSASKLALTAAAKRAGATPRVLADTKLPAGVPSTGRYAFLLKLDAAPTTKAFANAKAKGTSAAKSAARAQLSAVTSAQNKVVAALPSASKVIYRTHAVLSGLAVVTDVKNYSKLTALSGVAAVYPIAPKSASNSYAVPLQGAPAAWTAYGDLGADSTVAIIDTGIDYTHSDFGGPGTVAAYTAAKAQKGAPTQDGEYPSDKVIGGYDLAGDDYNADPTSDTYNPVPSPDAYPLDCNSHGTHVAGTVAGYGVNSDGSTYTGAYTTDTPFDTLRIGPGMAPEAKLYGFRVFGCDGSTDLVSAAIDRAADPNGDGSTDDHVDVINMSLGSDYGSPQDGDSVMSDAASLLGISVVVASGNAGDIYDVGGSPGNAPRTIAAAASADAYSQVDSLDITTPAVVKYPAERSIAYDYTTKPDLAGTVVKVSDPTNLDGCATLSTADAAAVSGHVAFVEWTDTGTRRCGSVARGANLAAAGASGFIFGDDTENFTAGITGDEDIPGVLLAKSGADAIRSQLANGTTVTVGSTTRNGASQFDTGLNDTLADFSSRGIRGAGNVKPDITAVGVSVFSASNGTGDEGQNDSGTSMATPMTAGAAALVRSQHPDWTPEQVKADLMNTAGQDLYTDPNHTGDTYAPNRVGAGRLDVKAALDNRVLAYVTDDAGVVSASFGSPAVSAATTLTKTIKVQNTSTSTLTYTTSYRASTTIPGATYSLSASSLTIDPRSSKTFTVTLTIDPTKLTKTIDPTVDTETATQFGTLARQFVADASGLVLLSSSGRPTLHVPVYSAPRPASVMTQPSSLTLPSGSVQSALVPLSGQRVNQGSGATAVQSTVAGFELAATSGLAPACTATLTSGCVNFADQRSADLKYVGITSDAPQVASIGGNPKQDGYVYFSVTTQGPWRTAASSQEFDVYIDTTGDGKPDLATFNTRATDSDVLLAETVNLTTGALVDASPLDDSLGDTDTAMFDSDTLVLPVSIAALGLGASSRISYAVLGFSPYASDPIDTIGDVNSAGTLTGALSFDPLHPGVAVYGSYDGDTSSLLYRDSPGSVLQVRRDAAAYALDKGKGALLVHLHNKVGSKAQVVALKTASKVSLTMTPNPVTHGKVTTAKVTVPASSGVPATGGVRVVRVTGPNAPTLVAAGTLANGTASLGYKPGGAGTFKYRVEYAGDGIYTAANSPDYTLTVK